MRHVVVDEWSRGASLLHRRDPRAKLICLILLLIAIPHMLGYAAVTVVAGVILARLPVGAYLARTAVVLPFAATLAVVASLTGDWVQGLTLVARSWLSAAAILLLIGTTSLPRVVQGLHWFRAPEFLLEVIQFVYRYVFVVAEQVWRMRLAAAARAGHRSYAAAVGTVSVLFARSYERAENIHHAMLARGYSGELPAAEPLRFQVSDFLLMGVLASYLAAAYLGS